MFNELLQSQSEPPDFLAKKYSQALFKYLDFGKEEKRGAQNGGGGGSAPDQNWGCDKKEDDILWARRCFRKAREMVATPVIRWGMRR